MKKQKQKPQVTFLQVGDELIFSDTKTQMEIVTVSSVNPNNGTAILSNLVEIYQQPVNGLFQRTSRKYESEIFKADESGKKRYEAYLSFIKLRKSLDKLNNALWDLNKMQLTEEQADFIIKANIKINKLTSKLD